MIVYSVDINSCIAYIAKLDLKLNNKEHDRLKCSILLNRSCPISILERFSKNESSSKVLLFVIINKKCSYSILKDIYKTNKFCDVNEFTKKRVYKEN